MTTCTNLIGDCMCTEGCCNQQYRNEYHCCETGYDGLIECDPLSIAQKTCLQLSDITKVDEYGNCLTSLTTGGMCNAECSQSASTVETCTQCVCGSIFQRNPKCPSTSKLAIQSNYNSLYNAPFSIAEQTCESVSTDYNQAEDCVLILANSGYCNAECNEPASTIETCTPCFCNIDGMKYEYPKCPSTSESAIKSRYNLFHNTSFWAAK